ncbi:MAG: dockerin type I repeat-containing protein [Halanaerobiaceae bacterium]
MGDLDDDGAINSIDLTLLTRYVLGNISHFPSENGLISADLNQDNLINSMDYALLRRYILGHISGF